MAEIVRASYRAEQSYEPPFRGACRTADAAVFARAAHEPAAAARAREEAAKAVCGGCPVRIPCRRHALASGVPHGVRGGLTADERHVLLLDPARTLRA
ncbi:WhiB family transcriptional regulator [Streptomyces sp. NPDC012888]|uniref:WhiB family transcriptional regulator n=1 Tax=Streptomyces sp. NPDC012888 TaxID=3364855 RepID=UPI0036B236FD